MNKLIQTTALFASLFAVAAPAIASAEPTSSPTGNGNICTYHDTRGSGGIEVEGLIHIADGSFTRIENVDVGYTVFQVVIDGSAEAADTGDAVRPAWNLTDENGDDVGTVTIDLAEHTGTYEILTENGEAFVAADLYCY